MEYIKTLLQESFSYSAINCAELLDELENTSFQMERDRANYTPERFHQWALAKIDLVKLFVEEDKRNTLAPKNVAEFRRRIDQYIAAYPDVDLF